MALPTHIDLQIVTPDKLVVRERVDEVEVPGSEGYFGVLPGHTPFLAALGIGELWYRKGAETRYVSIAFGFAEVLADSVTILAEHAERAEDIDVARAQAELARAEERIPRGGHEPEVEQARKARLKGINRLQVASRIGVNPGGRGQVRAQG